ncbi:MAG: glycerol-3-phosphate responsive antiterminator [Tissierellaceae bacterium]|nr:glycerol-3-phosphate responsive antiterminator [Tissierellaceae bacterium]
MSIFIEKVSENPIIASINDLDNLDIALNSNCEVIALLTGNIFNLKEISHKVHESNKILLIYIDKIDGFSKDTWGLEYIVKNIPLNGIITSRENLVKLSKDMGVFTIRRMFIPDTKSLEEVLVSVKKNRPHALEILPGIMPKVIKKIVEDTKIPLIAGGLISDLDDVKSGLDAGAIAISTSNKDVWYTKY